MTQSELSKILTVAGVLALWSQSKPYNLATHAEHKVAMVIGGVILYTIGLKSSK